MSGQLCCNFDLYLKKGFGMKMAKTDCSEWHNQRGKSRTTRKPMKLKRSSAGKVKRIAERTFSGK
jgi:hypothetical protein